MIQPTFEQVQAARKSAGLTQSQAAKMIGKSLKAWQNWECPPHLPSHRKMDAALFELFKIKASIK